VSFEWRYALAAMLGVCIAAGLFTALVELIWMARRGTLTRASICEMGRSLRPVPLLVLTSFALAGTWTALFTTAQTLAIAHFPVNAWTVLAALLAVDFSYYWEHRCAHKVGLLWRLYHRTHHSSPDYTVATAYRVNALSQFLAPAFYLPWVLLGFHPLLIVVLQQCAFHWQAWLHTELIGELGWPDRWFNTPAAHRMHHSVAPEHADRNLGAITLVWDRVFGSYVNSSSQIQYGTGINR
jgi:sterol desaturase/sphingolipid hydroxylase (fatty acid hydroxylase superfamily)